MFRIISFLIENPIEFSFDQSVTCQNQLVAYPPTILEELCLGTFPGVLIEDC